MAKIYDMQGREKGEIKLPGVFSTNIRPDVISRAFLAIQSHIRQPYGADPLAGKRTSAHYHGVRKGPHHMMNTETARMKRVHGGPPGQNMRARFSSGAVSGMSNRAPKAWKIWDHKINRKENRLAIMSAIAATSSYELVSEKHTIPEMELPIIITDEIQKVTKSKDVKKLIDSLNLTSEIERAKIKKVRPGRGKMRGRKYKKRTSILFVVSNSSGIEKAAKNIAGADVCNVSNINVGLLAPGAHAGRLTIFDESSIKKLGEIYG